MSDPIVPNYIKGVGRLVTDRYDFQDHIDGYNFRHKADQIDLSPTVVIDGYTVTNVQEAINTINNALVPPTISDATTSNKGIIQLSGDIDGTATNLKVVGLQNYPVSNLIPSNGQVLTWNNTNTIWEPQNAVSAFQAGGDLSGTNLSQDVIGIAGDITGLVTVNASNFNFSENSVPMFYQVTATSGSGSDFIINAQSSSATSQDGGFVKISGGSPGSSGLKGGVSLSLDNGTEPLFQISEVAAGRRVVSLAHDSDLTTTDMPANTGDRVIYIRDAATPPTSGSPVDGAILYSSGGKLRVKQEDGNDFLIGSIPNPSIWGSGNKYVYSYRAEATSSFAPVTAFTFTMPTAKVVKVDVLALGKRINSIFNEAYYTNMSRGFTINPSGGIVTALSTVNYFDTQVVGLVGIAPPTILNFSTTLSIISGTGAFDISWLFLIQLTICG